VRSINAALAAMTRYQQALGLMADGRASMNKHARWWSAWGLAFAVLSSCGRTHLSSGAADDIVCRAPTLDCGLGWCTDVAHDPRNCGGCGVACSADAFVTKAGASSAASVASARAWEPTVKWPAKMGSSPAATQAVSACAWTPGPMSITAEAVIRPVPPAAGVKPANVARASCAATRLCRPANRAMACWPAPILLVTTSTAGLVISPAKTAPLAWRGPASAALRFGSFCP
jgi:hypothetical protein